MTTAGIGAEGGVVSIRAANAAQSLIGPFSPLSGGRVEIFAGNGTEEAAAASGAAGGSIFLIAGSGGRDDGPLDQGDGGDIDLTPGPAGSSFGLGGASGAEGRILLRDANGQAQLTVNRSKVRIEEMLLLAVRNDSPTCNEFTLGSFFVRDRSAAPDAICVCLDNTGALAFGWFDLTGNVGCP